MKIAVLILLVTSFTKIESKIAIKIASDSVSYSGEEIKPVSSEELRKLLNRYSPTNTTEKVISVKSATVKSLHKAPAILLTQDFDNPSDITIKANAGITYAVENSLSVSWSKSSEAFKSQEVVAGITWYATATVGQTRSYSTTLGKNEEITESVTVGSSSAVEIELKPGAKIRAELSVTKGDIEIEVVYKSSYRGKICYVQEIQYKDPVFPLAKLSLHCDQIQDALKKVGKPNESTITETINLNFNVDGKVRVINAPDKK